MKFSLLIANYNNGKYFEDCYYSILAQTHKDWEAIIVDDGSTDNSVQIIENLIKSDDRFTLIRNETNKGCGFTKRKSLEFATGEICGFLDPDDALSKTALEHSLQHYSNKKIVATYSKIMFCDGDLNPQSDYKKVKEVHNGTYFFNCPIQIHHFFTFRKSAYDQTPGINPKLSSAVDQDLYLKVLEHGDPIFIPEIMYFYRRHAQGISQDSSKNKAKENFAEVIFDTFKRRKIQSIHGKKVPEKFPGAQKIYDLLEYQNGIPYRLQQKIIISLKKLF